MKIERPRAPLGFFPTPLVFLKNLTAHLKGPKIYMKRDDCSGLATGGNKTRKLEFLVADALKNNCDTLLTGGGMQSNHVRQTAAAAAQFGLKCTVILNESKYRHDTNYQKNGNVLLDHIFGATIQIVPAETNVAEALAVTFQQLKTNGANPYLIPMGGSNEIGALGYVTAATETFQQCKEHSIKATHLICASGSGGTQAGLIFGNHINQWDVTVIGFSVGIKNPEEKIRVEKVLHSLSESFKMDSKLFVDAIHVDENYIGVGYGQVTPESISAIKLIAQTEGILLDPVYTGKAMAGLIDYIQKGQFKKTDVIIFFHTGGNIALHAYVDAFL